MHGEDGKVDFDFDLKVDPTNERKKLNGHDAERVILTMETDIQVTPEGEESEDVGKLVVLIDSWNSVGGPAHAAVHRFNQAAGEQLAERMTSGRNTMSTPFSQDPKVTAAMQKAAEEAKQADGLEVRSTMYFVAVPAGMSFDRAAVLDAAQGKGAGETAKGKLMGALRGLGGGRQQEPKVEDPERKQVVLFKEVTEIRDLESTSLPASLFEVPQGYRELTLDGSNGS